MTREVISVRTDMDQEEVAQLVAKYNILAIPVVDDGNKLMGSDHRRRRHRRHAPGGDRGHLQDGRRQRGGAALRQPLLQDRPAAPAVADHQPLRRHDHRLPDVAVQGHPHRGHRPDLLHPGHHRHGRQRRRPVLDHRRARFRHRPHRLLDPAPGLLQARCGSA